MVRRDRTTLTELARLGFTELDSAREQLDTLSPDLVGLFASAADPDQALTLLMRLLEYAPDQTSAALEHATSAGRLIRVLGASSGLGEFFVRRPDEMSVLREEFTTLPTEATLRADLLASVAGLVDDAAYTALRVRYRRHLAALAAWDLENADPLGAVDSVTAMLSDLAGAALDASVDVARRSVRFPEADISQTRFAIIGMGKAGGRELNYLSDVDVIFVAEASGDLSNDRAVEIATRIAILTSRGIQDLAAEPGLWEVDANLRPEGKDGALVRTLESHLVYYDRWAKSWEFQALLKARPLAGDRELGARYVAAVAPLVWTSASRDNFVESVQRMRERVTANIPADERDIQVKLGPGGLRDIEFTIQLLQLVHGQHDDQVRQPATLPALVALAAQGYIGRVESAEFSRDYRLLRLIEHRLQLTRLVRTHLMPRDQEAVRVLARSTGLYTGAADLTDAWQRTKIAVRRLHERLFYRPLLSAVAALPDDDFALTSAQASARLAAIGFADPKGALAHIAALSGGVSRRATIQRALLPVMLQWFSEGAAPDRGLLSFRRLSDRLGEAYWFLRMLRDSSGAAQRLTHVLSSSIFAADLLERIPEGAAWLESEDELCPRSLADLLEESRATVARHRDDPQAASSVLRAARRREVLRLSLAAIVGVISVEELGQGLSDINGALLAGALDLARPEPDGIEFAVIAMGRYGGQELGFGSDADVMYVFRPRVRDGEPEISNERAQVRAGQLVQALVRYTDDIRLPFDLDAGLRPEGKNGAIVRSLDSYRAYYARWSLTWEAQALLRARGAAGDDALLRDFETLADSVRYPEGISEQDVREVKRIKARVESERLPQAADPSRHLKLGRGSLSDVEWLVQLLQLQHAAEIPGLRTTSTLKALAAATEHGLISDADSARLREAWLIASRARSGLTLWTSKTSDVLPTDRQQLEGVARLLEYPPGSASQLDDDYLRITRLARQVFERLFYGLTKKPTPFTG
jgi:glutamate-ammonia-ligase adenylyltransferase